MYKVLFGTLFFFIAIIIISLILDEIGFFDEIVDRIKRFAETGE